MTQQDVVSKKKRKRTKKKKKNKGKQAVTSPAEGADPGGATTEQTEQPTLQETLATWYSSSSSRQEPTESSMGCVGTSNFEDPCQPGQKSAWVARPSSQTSHSGKLSRRALTSGRLSPIPESSSHPAARGGLATPGSSTTAQTGSTGRRQPVTPDSTAEPSSTSSVSVHSSSGALVVSHSHPVGQSSQGAARQVNRGEVKCAMAQCKNRCDLWDGVAVICPKCGPYSEVRYCTQEHLFEDVKWHWVWCGRMTITHPRRELIDQRVRERMPLMPCFHNWDSPERHRQAVYFDRQALVGDYFVFADWADLKAAGFPADSLPLRCSTRIVTTVGFDDSEERDRFRRCLAVCLFCEYSLPPVKTNKRKLTTFSLS